MKFFAIVVFIIELWLSHKDGKKSGQDSQTLANWTGINESFLRKFAHVFLFFLLTLLSVYGFGPLAFVFCMAWAIADEITKKWMPGRHCSGFDMVLNLIGVGVGCLVWMAL